MFFNKLVFNNYLYSLHCQLKNRHKKTLDYSKVLVFGFKDEGKKE